MAQIQPGKTFGLVLSASALKGDKVVNRQGEDLGKIEELMIDLDRGRIAYAVLSFGGFLGMGDKLFAIPWQAFGVDTAEKRLVLKQHVAGNESDIVMSQSKFSATISTSIVKVFL